jgi:hypothetical protein
MLLRFYPFVGYFSPGQAKNNLQKSYYTAKQKPPYQRSGKAACQPGAQRQAKLNQTQGPAVGAARIVPRVCALLAH